MLGEKGETGDNTGGAARKEIARLQKGGMSLREIGEKVDRSPSVMSQIKRGVIKNPPESLIKKLRSLKAESAYGIEVFIKNNKKDYRQL